MATHASDLEVTTRKEVVELVEYCRQLEIKDQDLADSMETSASLFEASKYLEVYYKIDVYPYHEYVKQKIYAILNNASDSTSLVRVSDLSALINSDASKDDSFKAECTQVVTSAKNSDEMISAMMVDKKVEEIREYYLNTYVDKNLYYRSLQLKGIPVWKSRLAEDFEILKSPTVLVSTIVKLFPTVYAKVRKYFVSVLYTKAFAKDMISGEGLESINYYKAFCRMFLCTASIIEIINTKLERPLDIDYIDDYALDQLFFSFGFTEFQDLPDYYKKSLALKLNKLIRYKGTDAIYADILDVFDFKGVRILKYYIAKYKSDPLNKLNGLVVDPHFIGQDVTTPSLQEAIKKSEHRVFDFHAMTAADQHWECTKEEVAAQEFDFLPTKYFSIEADFDMWKDVISMAFLVSLIKTIKKKHQYKSYLKMYASRISKSEIWLDDMLLAAQILVIDFYGIEDTIHFDLQTVNKIYSFNDEDVDPLNNEVFGPDALTAGSFTHSKYVLEMVRDRAEISQDDLVSVFQNDSQVYKNFQSFYAARSTIAHTSDGTGDSTWTVSRQQYQKLKRLYQSKFLADYNLSEYAGYSTYTAYLADRPNKDLHAFVLACRAETDQETKRESVLYVLNALKEYTKSLDIRFDRMVSDMIVGYIERAVDVFKSYTVTMKDFRVVYRWDESMFFRFYDDHADASRFSWDAAVRSNLFLKVSPTSGSYSNAYEPPPNRDMLLSDRSEHSFVADLRDSLPEFIDPFTPTTTMTPSEALSARDVYGHTTTLSPVERQPIDDASRHAASSSQRDRTLSYKESHRQSSTMNPVDDAVRLSDSISVGGTYRTTQRDLQAISDRASTLSRISAKADRPRIIDRVEIRVVGGDPEPYNPPI